MASDGNFRAQGSPSSLHYKQLLQSQSLSPKALSLPVVTVVRKSLISVLFKVFLAYFLSIHDFLNGNLLTSI